jgi:hypothetical protein
MQITTKASRIARIGLLSLMGLASTLVNSGCLAYVAAETYGNRLAETRRETHRMASDMQALPFFPSFPGDFSSGPNERERRYYATVASNWNDINNNGIIERGELSGHGRVFNSNSQNKIYFEGLVKNPYNRRETFCWFLLKGTIDEELRSNRRETMRGTGITNISSFDRYGVILRGEDIELGSREAREFSGSIPSEPGDYALVGCSWGYYDKIIRFRVN